MTCLIRDSLYFSALFGFSKLPDYFYSPGRIFFLKHLSGHWSPQSAGPPWKGPLWFPRSAGPPWKGPLWPLVSMICWSTLERAAKVTVLLCCSSQLSSRAPAADLKCRSSRGALRENRMSESIGAPADCGKPCDCVIRISKERAGRFWV